MNKVVILLMIVLLSCAPRDGSVARSDVHTLYWEQDREGVPVFFLDGRNYGPIERSVPELKSLQLPVGSTLRIQTDATTIEDDLMPELDSGILNAWVKNGVQLEFFNNRERLDVQTVTWRSPDGGFVAKPQETEYIMNGVSIGKGDEAFSRLRKTAFADGTRILVVWPCKVELCGSLEPLLNAPCFPTWGRSVKVEYIVEYVR